MARRSTALLRRKGDRTVAAFRSGVVSGAPQAHAVRSSLMQFEGTKNYVATDDLKVAVNAAITLQRPLLIKGEPGT
ncbi:MAG TPA: hypothetical protein PLD46_08785, partial [Hyphomicrobium sp.]|nr:hypothetical protein [Hyphomicrobium sp.]